jgi:methanogenic corrinoid protein MtbC1
MRVLAGVQSAQQPSGPVVESLIERSGTPVIDEWLGLTQKFEGDRLSQGFSREWDRLGAVAFLDQRAAGFLRILGQRWAAGQIDVGHEHLASEQLREFLSRRWRPLSEQARAGVVVCATVENERHVLGLHMAATVLALSGFGIIFLGADVPVQDVADATRGSGAVAVALSATAAQGRDSAATYARKLSDRLDGLAEVIVGGSGFPAPIEGVHRFSDCVSLERWARDFARRDSGVASA